MDWWTLLDGRKLDVRSQDWEATCILWHKTPGSSYTGSALLRPMRSITAHV